MNRAGGRAADRDLIREIGRVDGVESVAGTSITVATGNITNTNVIVPGRTEPLLLGNYSVDPEFFATHGLRLLAGRTLSRRYANDLLWLPVDDEAAVEPAMRDAGRARRSTSSSTVSPPSRWAFAIPRQAIGRQLQARCLSRRDRHAAGDDRRRRREQPLPLAPGIGRADHVLRSRHLSKPRRPLPIRRTRKRFGRMSSGSGGGWCQTCRSRAQFAEDQLAELYATDAARGQTFAGFSALAVVIACLGLFGLAAFTAERRTKEIGIRKVFGARSRDIVRLLAWQFSKPVILANLIAWPVAWWVMRDWLNTFDARIDLGPTPFLLAGLLALVDRDRHRLRPRSCASRAPTRSMRFAMNRIFKDDRTPSSPLFRRSPSPPRSASPPCAPGAAGSTSSAWSWPGTRRHGEGEQESASASSSPVSRNASRSSKPSPAASSSRQSGPTSPVIPAQ